MVNRYMKRYSTSLIREMQIKTAIRGHVSAVRVTIINKPRDDKPT